MSFELGDEQIKADVLNRLMRRRCWGAKYLPTQGLISWIGKRVKNDGNRVRRAIGELIRSDLLIGHKGGNTISLNPRRRMEIIEYIDEHLI